MNPLPVRSPLWLLCASLTILVCLAPPPLTHAAEAARLVEKDGRHALLVDGRPYLVLGGQLHNSSGWPSELPQIWASLKELHANTVEAPVYWEAFEPTPGHYDTTNIDQMVTGARAHGLHVVFLWFGTWKNGNNHYVPVWVKRDPVRFPRTIRADGEPMDVMSPSGRNTQAADESAFAHFMRHLKEIDGDQHTVLMIQVENEAGNIGSIRDYSPASNAEFAGPVPADFLAATQKPAGTWAQVYGSEADELFQVYHQARYIDAVAAAGKAEFPILCSINAWLDYPGAFLPQRSQDQPGIGYPSGGAVQKLVGLWRKLAPHLDLIGPDIYSDDGRFVREVMDAYARPDNPLWIPEVAHSDSFAPYLFLALGKGAIGFCPFGVDQSGWNILGDTPWPAHGKNFALLGPINREIAALEFDGKLKTAVEEVGQTAAELSLGGWQATVAFGFPQPDGRPAPGTSSTHGAALVGQVGPDEFLITGVDASVIFHLPGKPAWIHSEIISAQEGFYENGVWKTLRLLNGDETDRGIMFQKNPTLVRVKMGRF